MHFCQKTADSRAEEAAEAPAARFGAQNDPVLHCATDDRGKLPIQCVFQHGLAYEQLPWGPGMLKVQSRSSTSDKRPARAQPTLVAYSISDSGVASVETAQMLQIPAVRTQVAAVAKLRLAAASKRK